MLGKLLDRRYQVTQVLGAGGFGKTYLAQDTRRPGNPICVVKQLKPISSDTGFLETARRLFTSEAETLEQLGNHDQIPRLLAYFEEDNEFFLVQEWIEGHTLTEELQPGLRWEESRVIDLLTEVLNILAFVHNRGVIHRDIKPDNLIRRNSDRKLVLVDFGAVKQMHTQLATNYAHSNTIAVGTPGYMSSEQARGQPRPNSDIYSLGVIAIQAITGLTTMQMQDDQNTGEILWEHLASVSRGLAAIITKMVRYHFKDRYQSASEVLQALKQLSAGYTIPQTMPLSNPQAVNRSVPAAEKLPRPEPTAKYTQAVSPGAASRQVSIDEPSYDKPSSSGGLMPLFFVFAAVVATSGAVAWRTGLFTSAFGGDKNYQTIKVSDLNCTVATSQLNVRSQPGTKNEVVDSLTKGTKIALTGAEQNGWVEINDPANGWVAQNLVNCKSTKPAPIEAKATPTPTPVKTTTPKPPTPVKPKPAEQNDADKLAKAADQYDNGNIDKAIAFAKSIPESSPAYQDAQAKIKKWQTEWTAAQTKYDQIQKALDEGRLDEVIRAVDPQLLQQSYWRGQFGKLIAEAQKRKAEAEAQLKKEQSQPPENPQPKATEKSPSVKGVPATP
jgi:serine/threonine protein kinase, bacterial